MVKDLVFDSSIHGKIKNRFCHKCNKEFENKDKIISKLSNSKNHKTFYYHKKCYEGMFI